MGTKAEEPVLPGTLWPGAAAMRQRFLGHFFSGHFLGNEQVLLQIDLVSFTAFTS